MATFVLAGALAQSTAACAFDVPVRTALLRGPARSPSPPEQGNAMSLAVAGRFNPLRESAVYLGGEAEVGMCARTSAGCGAALGVRNGAVVTGWSWVPAEVGARPGLDLGAVLGFGHPPGEVLAPGTQYHVAAALALTEPISNFDARTGYIVGGFKLELLAETRAGVWSPPGSSAGAADREVIVEWTAGLGVRLRLLTDVLTPSGYPHPTRAP